MIKELLIFLILLRQFNTEKSSDYLSVTKCIEEGGEILSRRKVCIPSKYLEYMQWKPDKKVGKLKSGLLCLMYKSLKLALM